MGEAFLTCPIRMPGRPGLVYSTGWFEQFAENLIPGLQFCGLVCEGQSLGMCKSLPSGGVDVLDTPVYWLLPNGETTCCTARRLQQDRQRVGLQPDSKDEYEAIGNAMGFTYLGGRCGCTDLLADPGTLQEQRWAQLPWESPKSSMEACWWLTNLPIGDDGGSVNLSMTAKLLRRSLAYLRAELHQNSVAN